MADYAIHDTTLTGISNVIRKKEGSSALIDPADYPKRINLMGMLEEKTASGAIANFSDGADDVPTKSLVVTIAPTLSGVSEVSETQTGSNVWDEEWELGAINVTNGQNVANNNFIRSTNYISVKPSTTYFKCAPQNYLQLYYGKDKTYLSYGSWNKNTTFTTPSDCYFVRFYVASEYGTTYNNDIALNYPSTFTEYAPYNGTQYTANLGRTIYGGQVDIVNGTGKETYAEIDMGDLTWTYDSTYSRFISASLPDCIKIDTARTTPILCSAYQVISDGRPISQVPDKSIYLSFHSSGSPLTDAFVHDSDYTDPTAFKTAVTGQKIVYQLKDSAQTDFTFDGQEIPTRLGYNAFWSDSGDTEVTYRSSGTVYQYPAAESEEF